MAFTPTEEAKLRAIIEAFDNGKTISEILASTEVFTADEIEIIQGGVSKKASINEIITLANSELNIQGIYMAEYVITTTDGVQETSEPYAVIGTNIFDLPTDFDHTKLSLFFDGSAQVRPTLSSVNNTATFSLVPLEQNDILILYYKKTL